MMIVDSQVHIWAADRPDRKWPPPAHGLKPTPHREVPISAESLLEDMTSAGVDRAYIVPPSWEGERNDLVADAVARFPDRYRYVARYDLRGAGARQWVRGWRSEAGMVALQMTFQTPVFQQPLLDGELDWFWPEAEKAGLPLTIYIPNALMPIIERVAGTHPGLGITINHFGLAGAARDEAAFADLGNLLALAKHGNVAVKASCLPFYTTEPYPFPMLAPHIKRVLDAFGPRRTFWGTDLSRLNCSYRQAVTHFTEELPWLQGQDLEWVMGRGILEWLGWDAPGVAGGRGAS